MTIDNLVEERTQKVLLLMSNFAKDTPINILSDYFNTLDKYQQRIKDENKARFVAANTIIKKYCVEQYKTIFKLLNYSFYLDYNYERKRK